MPHPTPSRPDDDTPATNAWLHDAELIDQLAAVEHERWAHWQRYLHAKCDELPDGSLRIPEQLVTRWRKQINTPYDRLSADEQASDREQVAAYLDVLARWLDGSSTSRDES